MLTTAALLAASMMVPVNAADAPPMRVEVVTANGSGCPAGTTDVSTTNNTFSVSYHSFFAQAGGGAGPVTLHSQVAS